MFLYDCNQSLVSRLVLPISKKNHLSRIRRDRVMKVLPVLLKYIDYSK